MSRLLELFCRPAFIVYATATAYENGKVHFCDEIYGQDASLVEALVTGYPYPSRETRPVRSRGASPGPVRHRPH